MTTQTLIYANSTPVLQEISLPVNDNPEPCSCGDRSGCAEYRPAMVLLPVSHGTGKTRGWPVQPLSASIAALWSLLTKGTNHAS